MVLRKMNFEWIRKLLSEHPVRHTTSPWKRFSELIHLVPQSVRHTVSRCYTSIVQSFRMMSMGLFKLLIFVWFKIYNPKEFQGNGVQILCVNIVNLSFQVLWSQAKFLLLRWFRGNCLPDNFAFQCSNTPNCKCTIFVYGGFEKRRMSESNWRTV